MKLSNSEGPTTKHKSGVIVIVTGTPEQARQWFHENVIVLTCADDVRKLRGIIPDQIYGYGNTDWLFRDKRTYDIIQMYRQRMKEI